MWLVISSTGSSYPYLIGHPVDDLSTAENVINRHFFWASGEHPAIHLSQEWMPLYSSSFSQFSPIISSDSSKILPLELHPFMWQKHVLSPMKQRNHWWSICSSWTLNPISSHLLRNFAPIINSVSYKPVFHFLQNSLCQLHSLLMVKYPFTAASFLSATWSWNP